LGFLNVAFLFASKFAMSKVFAKSMKEYGFIFIFPSARLLSSSTHRKSWVVLKYSSIKKIRIPRSVSLRSSFIFLIYMDLLG
jgi:hypothetical protein